MATSAFAFQASAATSVLVDIVLPGTQQTTVWANTSLASGNPTGIPTSGVGSISPIAPGFRAGGGFYSPTGDFGAKATTTTTFSPKEVVFQLVLANGPVYTAADVLTFGGTYLAGFNPEEGYIGGPILNYNGGSQGILFELASLLAGPVEITVQGNAAEYYALSWKWSLMGITEEITSIEIIAPVPAHNSVIEARIDAGSAVPEPSTYAALLGAAALGLVVMMRRRRTIS
jgi:hypothetical protein